jgi:ABC-type multidrug transport system permease subunit
MYHAGIDAISSLASTWPIKLVSVSLFDTELYFLANLKREPGAFFIFLLFTYTTVLLMGSIFRLIAAVNKHQSTAVSIAGLLILPMVIYTGCKFKL